MSKRRLMLAGLGLGLGLASAGCDDTLVLGALPAKSLGGARVGTLWAPVLDFALEDPTWSGDPYEDRATVTFTHDDSGDQHVTSMFYGGGDTWRFRFTGTRVGAWSYRTSSEDPDLDGWEGTVSIDPNPDPSTHGFATGRTSSLGTQWARPRGNDGELEVFVPQLVMMPPPHVYLEDPGEYLDRIDAFFDGGMRGVYVHSVDEDWLDPAGDPDPATFEALEAIITHVHAAGGFVHVWGWNIGEEPRASIDGPAHARLLRYIAARLGPLPGWSFSYGSAERYLPAEKFHAAVAELDAHWGWPHLVGGRAEGPRRGTDHSPYLDWQTGLGYSGFAHIGPSYQVFVAAMRQAPDKPILSEDRFRVHALPDPGDPEFADVVPWHWLSTMAGGVGSIWANFIEHKTSETKIRAPYEGSAPFPPHVEEGLRTYRAFWEGRLDDDLRRHQVAGNVQALRRVDFTRYLVYARHTRAIALDLSGAAAEASLPVTAIDTRAVYEERALAPVVPNAEGETVTIALPYESDWALVVGE